MLKLTSDTLEILKNFSAINPNLVIKEGSTLATIAEAKNILSEAKITEKFDKEFGIYDLNEFLAVLSLIQDPELELTEDSVLISDGKDTSIRYRYANISTLTAPTKAIKMPTADLTVDIYADTLKKIRQAAGALGHSVVAIEGDKKKINLVIRDAKDESANTYTVALGNNQSGESFSYQFLIDNLKLIGGDFTVEISSKLISKWTHKTRPIVYHIALEKTSTATE